MARDFTAKKVTSFHNPLIIGIMGPPGGGKSMSALRLGMGMCRVTGGRLKVIDTEGGRAAKYARDFDFDHVFFEPPFKPGDFKDAIEQQVRDGAGAIVVDSLSDEHEGRGGVLDWHDEELDRMAGNDWAKRERVGQAAWIKPKRARLDMINAIIQIRVPMIFTFRAREKVKQMKNDRGKMEPTNIGYQPIAPLEIVHQLDMTCLLPPRADGVPVWKSDKIGEDFIIKLPIFLRPFIKEGEQLSEAMGEAFAKWARGGSPSQRLAPQDEAATPPAASSNPLKSALDELLEEGDTRAKAGTAALQSWWTGLEQQERTDIGRRQLDTWKNVAESADKERAEV